MKKIYLAILMAVMSVGIAHADQHVDPYGQLWSSATDQSLTFTQAVFGAKASLGEPASVDLSYNALTNSLYTAAAAYHGLVLSGDSLSVGLQASAVDKWLDQTLGQSALNCFGCTTSKSAIYQASVLGGDIALTGNENHNYSLAARIGVLPGVLSVLGQADYDNPTNNWMGRGGLQLTQGVFALVADASVLNSTWDYGVAGKASIAYGLGVFAKYRQGGAILVGPTYDASKHLQVALAVSRPQAGADYGTDLRLSANF